MGKTLIHFSGGMDSSFALYDWLRTNKDNHREQNIIVHHIQFNSNLRTLRETLAVERTLEFFVQRGLTKFEYFVSGFEQGTLPHLGLKDIQIVSLYTAMILKQPTFNVDKILVPWHKGETSDNPVKKGYRIKNALKGFGVETLPEFIFPIEHLTRREIATLMQKELLEITSSCRKPLSITENCGVCRTCQELKEAGILDIVGTKL